MSSFVYRLGSALWLEIVVCVALPVERSDGYFPLSNAIGIERPNHVLPQQPFVSSEVFKRVKVDQSKVHKDTTLVIRDNVGRVCGYPLTYEVIITV